MRPRPDGELELVLAHPTGFAEIWYGIVTGAKIELSTDVVARTALAKDVTSGQRLCGLVDGDLLWAYDMAAQGQPLQPHLWGKVCGRDGLRLWPRKHGRTAQVMLARRTGS